MYNQDLADIGGPDRLFLFQIIIRIKVGNPVSRVRSVIGINDRI